MGDSHGEPRDYLCGAHLERLLDRGNEFVLMQGMPIVENAPRRPRVRVTKPFEERTCESV